jgi:L-alanine-DL-glutamate epimerase-like enolase superfamily enzyme
MDAGAPRFHIAEPFVATADGWMQLSDRPGFGVELDEAALKRTRSDRVP